MGNPWGICPEYSGANWSGSNPGVVTPSFRSQTSCFPSVNELSHSKREFPHESGAPAGAGSQKKDIRPCSVEKNPGCCRRSGDPQYPKISCWSFYLHNLFLGIEMSQVVQDSLSKKIRTFPFHSQYHSSWCPGDWCRQGISSHDIDPVCINSEQSLNQYFAYFKLNALGQVVSCNWNIMEGFKWSLEISTFNIYIMHYIIMVLIEDIKSLWNLAYVTTAQLFGYVHNQSCGQISRSPNWEIVLG